MSYENLLTDRCDIYHLKDELADGDGGYGIPVQDRQKKHDYSDLPDLDDVKCYFVSKNQSLAQNEPNRVIVESWLVHFLVSTDIKINSKVIWDGVTYKAQKPRKVRNHHQEVTLVRSDNL